MWLRTFHFLVRITAQTEHFSLSIFTAPTNVLLMQLEFLIAYSSFGSISIPLLIAALQWNRMTDELKTLRTLLILSLLADLISIILIRFSINTYWVGNIFMITQLALLIIVFRSQLQYHLAINSILLISILFCLLNIGFIQGPFVFNSLSNVVACLILISFCLYYFYRLLNDLPTIHIQHLPMLWISFGVLTYYGGNFFLFLVKNYLTYGEAGSHKLMWILHNLLNIVKNVLFAIGLWKGYRKVRSSTLSSSAP